MGTVYAPTWSYPPGFGDQPTRAAERPRITARYDNAQNTPENSRHWIGTDTLSAKAANSFQVRRNLRMRSRYEVANNPYLFGIVTGNADDLISTGPTLQVQTPDAAYNRHVEAAFKEWADEVDLTEKLKTAKLGRTIDGEGFLILKNAPSLENPVKVYPVDIEADQVTTVAPNNLTDLWVDGLTLDPVTERPTHYHVLAHHPGDYYFPGLNPLKTAKVDASNVVHWFQKVRAGQVRGIPTFTPSLDLFTELRAFRRAVVRAADIAADFSAVLEQELGAAYEGDEDGGFKPFSTAPIRRGMFVTLPPKTTLKQMTAAHPTTSYESFQEKCLSEAVRPLAYPLNLALGTSQKFNFSSAKLDHTNYRNSLNVERDHCTKFVLAKLFKVWWYEAILSGAVRPFDGMKCPPIVWHWPGYEPLDPVADTQADSLRLAGGQQTLREFWAKRGADYRDVLKQLAEEKKLLETWGLSFGDVVKRTVTEDADDEKRESDPAAHPKPAKPDQKPTEKASDKPSEKVVKKALGAADVQNTALNGAQVSSMIAVCDKLVTGEYTGAATRAILKGSFPGLDGDLFDTIVDELEGHTPPAPKSPEREPAHAA